MKEVKTLMYGDEVERRKGRPRMTAHHKEEEKKKQQEDTTQDTRHDKR